MPAVELVGRDALAELGQQLLERCRLGRRLAGQAAGPEERGPQTLGARGLAQGPRQGMAVEVVEPGTPGILAEPLQGRAGDAWIRGRR